MLQTVPSPRTSRHHHPPPNLDVPNLNEFEEILQAEVYVDVEKLRDSARHGIPAEIRGEVWKYLLGVQQADRSQELTTTKARSEEYQQIEKQNSEITKRVRGEVNRYQRRVPNLASSTFENVICAYLNYNRQVDYFPALVPLCAPFVVCLKKESEVYYCFERLQQQMEDYYTQYSVNEKVANFIALFRYIIPDLHEYFEEEEVELNEWATSWLRYLLAKELQLDNLMRLFDTYFAIPDPLDFHTYVCLSILLNLNAKERLEELEQSEIRSQLMRLPMLDMEQIINQAFNIRHETLQRQIVENMI